MSSKPKFKVGDIVRYCSGNNRYKITHPRYGENGIGLELNEIMQIENGKYYIEWWRPNDTNIRRSTNTEFRALEKYNEIYHKKIPSTKLSRKLYAGKIEKEQDGELWIKM